MILTQFPMSPDVSQSRARVRAAAASLTKPGSTDLQTVVQCMREIDTALRVGSEAEQNDAAGEFCRGPDGATDRSALRWCATALQRGIPDGLNPQHVKASTFTVGITLQILISVSGADHRQQFGHVTRNGEHHDWPTRGAELVQHHGWSCDMWTPTGILPPLLHLTRSHSAGPQIRLRALQLAGSIARDPGSLSEMLKGGWLDVSVKALEHRPRPDHTEQETKEFIYQRETWQFLRDTLLAAAELGEKEESFLGEEETDNLHEKELAEKETDTADEPLTRVPTRVALEAGERTASSDDFPKGDTEWHGRMVRIRGLLKKQILNGTLGFAQGPDAGSNERVLVLVNPLENASRNETKDSTRAEPPTAAHSSPSTSTGVLSIHRKNLCVFDAPGLSRRDVASGDGSAAAAAASVAVGEAAERREGPVITESGNKANDGVPGGSQPENPEPDGKVLEEQKTYDVIVQCMREADTARDAGDHDDAVKHCAAAVTAATETCENKSLVRAFTLHMQFKAHLEMASAAVAVGDLDAVPRARADALASAGEAMDLVEFRTMAKLRDGRQGELPTSSLLELTDDETRFIDTLCQSGRTQDVKFVCGASLAVALADEAFAPALAEVVRMARSRNESGTGDSGTTRDSRTEKSYVPDPLTSHGQAKEDTPDFETLCWQRMSTALRAVDAQRRLGALAVRWRPRGVVGESFGDVPGPNEHKGSTRHHGYAVPAALPKGTHVQFRLARARFLRKYLDLLIGRFVGSGGETGGGDGSKTKDSTDNKVSLVGDALRVEPLLLQFSVGGFRDLMVNDEVFVATDNRDFETGNDDVSNDRRARGAGEASDAK